MRTDPRTRELARYGLAAIRLFNGASALLAPASVAPRLGVDLENNPAAGYVLRLFGVRTVVLGAELLLLGPEELDRVLRVGFLVHACDVLSAVHAGSTGRLPRRVAAATALVSAVNVALSVLAREGDGSWRNSS